MKKEIRIVKVKVEGIEVCQCGECSARVFLVEEDGQRWLRPYIGPFEARAILMKLSGQTPPRPLTHDLAADIIRQAGLNITKAVITELRDNTYYANLVDEAGGVEKRIDCRPSDAIAMALRLGIPIYANEELLEELEGKTARMEADIAGRPFVFDINIDPKSI